jgi:Pentapeptide repeats (8 copies)
VGSAPPAVPTAPCDRRAPHVSANLANADLLGADLTGANLGDILDAAFGTVGAQTPD